MGAYFGLTSKKYQSGERDVTGAISRVGDAMVRVTLYEAANIMLSRVTRFSSLKRWALQSAQSHLTDRVLPNPDISCATDTSWRRFSTACG
jgi:transposase